jgi:hypothetical protein
MSEIKRKIEPQPKLPIVGIFHSTTEDYEDYYGWCYQNPESDPEMPKLVYNAPHTFNDPNQPDNIGGSFEGKTIKRVRVQVESGIAYWIITLEE